MKYEMNYELKPVKELAIGDVLAHGAVVTGTPEWFPGAWRSPSHWTVPCDNDPVHPEFFRHREAIALIQP